MRRQPRLSDVHIISHGRYVAFQMAEVAIPRNLFADILRLIAELRRRQSHQPRKAFVRYASEPNSGERCASMTENSAIFTARHGAGSFHPPSTARANGAGLPKNAETGQIGERPGAIW
jgi:hypothetical protein